jgi:hypothetical protein
MLDIEILGFRNRDERTDFKPNSSIAESGFPPVLATFAPIK